MQIFLGLATSFFNDRNRNLASALLDLLIEAKQDYPSWLEGLANDGRVPSAGRRGGKGRYGGSGGGNSFGARDYRQTSGGNPQRRGGNSYGGGFGGSSGNGGKPLKLKHAFLYNIHFRLLFRLLRERQRRKLRW